MAVLRWQYCLAGGITLPGSGRPLSQRARPVAAMARYERAARRNCSTTDKKSAPTRSGTGCTGRSDSACYAGQDQCELGRCRLGEKAVGVRLVPGDDAQAPVALLHERGHRRLRLAGHFGSTPRRRGDERHEGAGPR